jgi:hypothetical protein
MQDLGRNIIIFGVILLVIGLILSSGIKIPRLPGDIYIDKPGVRVYFPLASSIIISIILTILLNIFRK